jgi:hypothetical protein
LKIYCSFLLLVVVDGGGGDAGLLLLAGLVLLRLYGILIVSGIDFFSSGMVYGVYIQKQHLHETTQHPFL